MKFKKTLIAFFVQKKSDILDTELNFARYWSGSAT